MVPGVTLANDISRVSAAIHFAEAQLILSAISLWDTAYVPTAYQTVLMFWAIIFVCFLINVFGAKHLDLINKVCIYWTATSVLIILITVLSMADTKRSGKFVFTHYDASASGWYVLLISGR